MEGKFIPFLDGVSDGLYALPLPTEWINGVDIGREDVLQRIEVLGVQSEAVLGNGVLNGEIVYRFRRRHVWFPMLMFDEACGNLSVTLLR